jgi:hypothetical protein
MLEKGILKRREDEKIEGEGDASDVIDTQVGK